MNKHNKCNFSKLLSIQTLHESNQIATTSAAQRSVRRSVEITTISNSSFVLIRLDCGQTQARRCGELRNVFSVTFNVVGQRDPINRMVTDISPTIPGQFVPSLLFHHLQASRLGGDFFGDPRSNNRAARYKADRDVLRPVSPPVPY